MMDENHIGRLCPTKRFHQRLAGAANFFAVFAWSLACQAEEAPRATPFRPGIGDPAALSLPGWVEVEAGWQRAGEGEDTRRDTIPYLFKLAFTENWGVLVGGDAYAWVIDQNGARADGVGDTSVLVKYRLPVAGAVELAVQGGVVVPTAPEMIGSGETDYVLTGIVSFDFDPYALDLNIGGTRFGRLEEGEERHGIAWSASLGRSITEDWEVGIELSGEHREGARGTALALASTSYAVTDRIVVDFGAAKGLGEDADDWQVFAGFTVLLTKLF
jgi:hypothetical protein